MLLQLRLRTGRQEGLSELHVLSVCGCIDSSVSHSEVATFFNFAKASIGSGSFALPWGIFKIGVVMGVAGMILLSIARCVCVYSEPLWIGRVTHTHTHM